ncbi:MAG TPA: glycoside hydrolase domain-containing protein [Solirubrobacterales bacterium]|nr:glycoside hydrolase domain-containing protein [Solirubrobacterales bacterium]
MAARCGAFARGLRVQAGIVALVVAMGWTALAGPDAAWADSGTKTVHYRGQEVKAPASWPVIRLDRHPGMCVRLDRRAVYLGTPAASQRCPSNAIGRNRAIVVDPIAEARAARATTSAIAPGAAGSAIGGSVFTGLGFDACAAPSSRTMAAWADSPYRAVGVYIGGLNRACSQPNLTTRWVGEQVAGGWHLIPTYVGLQAPTSSCGSCAKLSPGVAVSQGSAQAADAVADARAIGMGPGSPIYFDMESYTQTVSATNATLKFLEAWTEELHALGYQSGVYSSSGSGIEDLVGRLGTLYTLPDHIWMANWDGRRTTADPYVPAGAWSLQQRIRQYRGGHDERWGGVTINIDNNYLDGGTVGPAIGPVALPPLTVSRVKPQAGTVRVRVRCGWAPEISCPGQIIMRSNVRLPARGRNTTGRVVRIAVARRAFRLGGGKSHTFRVALNPRGRPLLRQFGTLKTQLLVAIPGARATRTLQLTR